MSVYNGAFLNDIELGHTYKAVYWLKNRTCATSIQATQRLFMRFAVYQEYLKVIAWEIFQKYQTIRRTLPAGRSQNGSAMVCSLPSWCFVFMHRNIR
jgi:hypothetical protein